MGFINRCYFTVYNRYELIQGWLILDPIYQSSLPGFVTFAYLQIILPPFISSSLDDICHDSCSCTVYSILVNSLLHQQGIILSTLSYLCFLTPRRGSFIGTINKTDTNATMMEHKKVSRSAAS